MDRCSAISYLAVGRGHRGPGARTTEGHLHLARRVAVGIASAVASSGDRSDVRRPATTPGPHLCSDLRRGAHTRAMADTESDDAHQAFVVQDIVACGTRRYCAAPSTKGVGSPTGWISPWRRIASQAARPAHETPRGPTSSHLTRALPLKKPVPSVTMPHPGCCARETIHRSSAEYVALTAQGEAECRSAPSPPLPAAAVEVAELPASSGGMASL